NQNIAPDRLAVYCGSGLGQLDNLGMGGVLTAMLKQERTITKQLPFSYPQMTADFINAYIINNLGQTGNCCGACATFLYNLALAVTNIKIGKVDLAIVGTSEAPILPQLMSAFYNMGAMTSDSKISSGDFSKASLPFGNNFGFVMGESAQFVVLASAEAAYKLGARIHGAVPDVFISADGAKRSISSPGPGNYITVAKALAAAGRILGDKKVAKHSYVHAHGTSTPQNRVTESQILSSVAKHFKIKDWPVLAVKSYLGHSQATAGGDQIMAALGYWKHSILPGINTVDDIADDVASANLRFNLENTETAKSAMDVSFINAKGFGGNNATAILFSPDVAENIYKKEMGSRKLRKNLKIVEKRQQRIDQYLADAENGKFSVRYELAQSPPTDKDISLRGDKIIIDGYPPIDI
nr:beta-ketoacyl synthase [Gammaproteobacteria bacterium]